MSLRFGGLFVMKSNIVLMNTYYRNFIKILSILIFIYLHNIPKCIEGFSRSQRTELYLQGNMCIRTHLC